MSRGTGFKDISGQKFGRLLAIEYAHSRDRKAHWHCICDCGNETIVSGKQMRAGKSASCGCLQKERASLANKTHGKSKTKLFRVLGAIKNRTGNQNQWNYKYYGGRGIKLFDEWKSFDKFYDWAMANGYKDGLSIERVDVNGDYCPENCTWIPIYQQQGNRRNSKKNAIR